MRTRYCEPFSDTAVSAVLMYKLWSGLSQMVSEMNLPPFASLSMRP